MPKTAADNVTARLQAALRDESQPLWLPELTPALVNTAWHRVGRDLHLTRSSYGTVRVLRRNPEETRWLVASVSVRSPYPAGNDDIPIELLPEDLCSDWPPLGSRFFGVEEIVDARVYGLVEEALEILAGAPALLPTVSLLIRSLHLIDTADDQIDMSFSDPGFPFSVFVSVPGRRAENSALRVAEAILHEAMHLQLSLIEGFLPLVSQTETTYFSPWINQYRSPQSVLHALYVFRVIDSFFGTELFGDPSRAILWRDGFKRREEIVRQIRALDDFRACPSLTQEGAALVSRLLG